VSHERRGDAEADDVGEGVELHAEFGGGAGHAGDAAVERIEEDGEADSFGRAIKLIGAPHEASDHGVIPAEEIRHGEHAGKEKNAAAKLCAAETPFLERNFLLLEFSHLMFASQLVRDFLPRNLVFARAIASTLHAAANTQR